MPPSSIQWNQDENQVVWQWCSRYLHDNIHELIESLETWMALTYPRMTLDSICSLFILLSLPVFYSLFKFISPANHRTKILTPFISPNISTWSLLQCKFRPLSFCPQISSSERVRDSHYVNGWESESRHLSQTWPQVFEFDSIGICVILKSVFKISICVSRILAIEKCTK